MMVNIFNSNLHLQLNKSVRHPLFCSLLSFLFHSLCIFCLFHSRSDIIPKDQYLLLLQLLTSLILLITLNHFNQFLKKKEDSPLYYLTRFEKNKDFLLEIFLCFQIVLKEQILQQLFHLLFQILYFFMSMISFNCLNLPLFLQRLP